MSYFIAGLGSMGKRRIRCLLANNVDPKSIIGFDHREDRRKESEEKHSICTTDSFNDFKSDDVKAVIVSLWPHLHIKHLLEVAKVGKNWFCEVPLSLTTENLEELKEIMIEKKTLGAIGSQMIFHPGSIQLKKWFDEDRTGSVVTCWGASTSYFPGWHPYEKITDYYLADIDQGGANIDIVGHDVQWFMWFFGKKIKSVIATSSQLGNLDFVEGSPDTINTILEFEDGTQFSWHFNGVNRACDRGVWLAGNETTMMWDLRSPKSRLFDIEKNAWIESGPDEFDYEQAYVREIRHFINQLESGKTDWPLKFDDGIQMAKLITAVNKSINNNGIKVEL